MTPEPANPGRIYDVFVSYAREDIAFARALEQALEAYRPPADLAVPQRHLKVFLDVSDFTGVDYAKALDEHLDQSGTLVAVCSPDARASLFVDDEIRRFASRNDVGRVIPLLLRGTPNNEARTADDPAMAFPTALCEVHRMPLAADYRGFTVGTNKPNRGAYESAWFVLLANIYGVAREVLEGRERARRLRERRRVVAVSAVLAIVLGVAASVALWQSRVAGERQLTAQVRQWVLQSKALQQDRGDLGLLVAAEAYRHADVAESRQGLLAALLARPELQAHLWAPPAISALKFAPDGKVLATASCIELEKAACGRREVRLYSVATHALLGTIERGAGERIRALAFSADGSLLAVGDGQASATLFSVATRAAGATYAMPAATRHTFLDLEALAFSPDGRLLLMGGCGSNSLSDCDAVLVLVGLADARAAVPPTVLPKRQVVEMAFVDDTKVQVVLANCNGPHDELALACGDIESRQWDTGTRGFSPATRLALPVPAATEARNPRTALALDASGRRLAQADCARPEVFRCVLGRVALHGANADAARSPLTGHAAGITRLAFNGEGSLLASGAGDGSVMLWRTDGRGPLEDSIQLDAESLFAIAYRNDETLVAGGCGNYSDGLPRCVQSALVRLSAGGQEQAIKLPQSTAIVRAVAIDPTTGRLAAGTNANRLFFWSDAERASAAKELQSPLRSVNALRFSPDGSALLAAGSGGLAIWDTKTWTLRWHLRQPGRAVLAVAINRVGTVVAGAGDDGRVTVHTLADGQEMAVLAGYRGAFTALHFARDGRLVAAGEDGIVTWDLRSGERMPWPPAHSGPIIGIALSADEASLASAGLDRHVMLWDVQGGRPTGQPLTLSAAQAWRAVAFSPSGGTLAAVGSRGNVTRWPLSPATWLDLACRTANRNLTEPEWSVYFPGEVYRKTCVGLR